MSWNRDQDGGRKDVSVEVSTASLGWPGRVLMEQELLWECSELLQGKEPAGVG